MSSLPRSSKPPWPIEELDEPNRSFGPSPDSPDFIFWPTLALHERKDKSIKPRSQIQVSDCRQPTTITQTDDRTASIRDKTAAFKAQLAPWLGGYNRQNRSDMDSNTTVKEETLSAWKAQVETIAANMSEAEGITIIVCPTQRRFAQTVSKHVQTPNKTERRLINKLNLPKLEGPEEELKWSKSHQSTLQETAEIFPRHVIKGYSLQDGYISDIEVVFASDNEDAV